MDEMTYDALAKARIERAKELLDEAEELLETASISPQITELFMLSRKV